MATWLHKDGEKELVDPAHVPQMLNAGWSASEPSNDDSDQEHEKGDTDQDQDDDSNASEPSNDDIREAAKAAGIDKWDTKRISTLRSELGYDA